MSPTPTVTLTPREYKVIDLLATGMSLRDVASRLECTTGALYTHITRAVFKAGCKRESSGQALQGLIRMFNAGMFVSRAKPPGSHAARPHRISQHERDAEAKWDRIFRERFEDPTYYQRGPEVRYSSPLASL
jgi:DNA-binding CsgD family transcriptional regulator